MLPDNPLQPTLGGFSSCSKKGIFALNSSNKMRGGKYGRTGKTAFGN